MKTIVLGVGNPILGDDGVGIRVVRELDKELKKEIKNTITIEEALTGGINLLDLIVGYDKAVIVDAVKSERDGEVVRVPLNLFSRIRSCNPHDVSLVEAVELAKRMGQKEIPREIVVIGITMKRIPNEFGDELSERIKRAVPKAVEMVLKEIGKDGV